MRTTGEGQWGDRQLSIKEGALEIPLFYENDAYGWVNRWEGYFLIKGVTKEKNLHATMVAMEGKYLS